MVFPGAHVDVICSTRFANGKVVSNTILKNKLVLAVSSTLDTTLAVTPREAGNCMLRSNAARFRCCCWQKKIIHRRLRVFCRRRGQSTNCCTNGQRLGDARNYFRDLPAFAPGLNTTDADIASVLDAESRHAAPALGRIDDAAREPIETARSAGWREVTSARGTPRFSGPCNGSRPVRIGTKATEWFDRASGLRWFAALALYPDLGLGAKRLQPFHAAEWRSHCRGWSAGRATGSRGRCRAAFGSFDRGDSAWLGERKDASSFDFWRRWFVAERIAIEMPSKTILSHLRFDAADFGDSIAERTIRVDMSKFVVLNLPYRTLAHVEAKYGRKAFGNVKNETSEFDELTDAQQIEFLSAAFAEGAREKVTQSTAAEIIAQMVYHYRYTTGCRRCVLLENVPCGGFSDVFTATGHPLVAYFNNLNRNETSVGRMGADGFLLQTSVGCTKSIRPGPDPLECPSTRKRRTVCAISSNATATVLVTRHWRSRRSDRI